MFTIQKTGPSTTKDSDCSLQFMNQAAAEEHFAQENPGESLNDASLIHQSK